MVLSANSPSVCATASRVSVNSGESWRFAGAVTVPKGIPPLASTARERLVPTSLSPIYRASAFLLATARGLCDAAVHSHIRQVQPDEAIVVGFEGQLLPQGIHRPQLDPLVASRSLSVVAEHVPSAILS
jgi:hypothetical protein